MVRFAYSIRNFTGSQDWLEQYTGAGTTTGMYKLFGVLLAIVGLLIMTGLGTPILKTLLEPIAGMFNAFK